MWMTKTLASDSEMRIESGVTLGGKPLTIRGRNASQTPETLFPYGFTSLPEQGEKAVLVDGYCAGVSQAPDSALQEGEVRLYSAGGAEILLTRSGDVIINGQVFHRP